MVTNRNELLGTVHDFWEELYKGRRDNEIKLTNAIN